MVDLAGIMLSEVSQTDKDKYLMCMGGGHCLTALQASHIWTDEDRMRQITCTPLRCTCLLPPPQPAPQSQGRRENTMTATTGQPLGAVQCNLEKGSQNSWGKTEAVRFLRDRWI